MGVDPRPAITLNLHFYLKQLAGVLVSEAVLPAQVQKGVNKSRPTKTASRTRLEKTGGEVTNVKFQADQNVSHHVIHVIPKYHSDWIEFHN